MAELLMRDGSQEPPNKHICMCIASVLCTHLSELSFALFDNNCWLDVEATS